jgi:hypothetical protein
LKAAAVPGTGPGWIVPTVLAHYYFTDPLGSSRMVADNSGVLGESDYYPYGGEILTLRTFVT